MRRNDKRVESRDWIDKLIINSEVCRIAYANDNMPYITPVSFGYDGKNLFVHTAEEGKKIEFLKNNNYICFEFDADVKTITDENVACKWTAAFKSAIGYGRMIKLDSFQEKAYAINEIMKHYSGKSWDFDEKSLKKVALWKIEIEELSGKQSEN